MSIETWRAVDDYLSERVAPNDAALDAAIEDSRAGGLPDIAISPNQGKFLQVLAHAAGARRILELGTLGGYSTIWLARALPAGGVVVSLEHEPKHAEVARANLARAGVADRVEVRVGRALDTLAELRAEGAEPFDLFFIDADKPSIPEYFEAAIGLGRPGSLIVVDNVVRDGELANTASTDEAVNGCQRLMELLPQETRAISAVVQTVGVKGHDGFAIATVL